MASRRGKQSPPGVGERQSSRNERMDDVRHWQQLRSSRRRRRRRRCGTVYQRRHRRRPPVSVSRRRRRRRRANNASADIAPHKGVSSTFLRVAGHAGFRGSSNINGLENNKLLLTSLVSNSSLL